MSALELPSLTISSLNIEKLDGKVRFNPVNGGYRAGIDGVVRIQHRLVRCSHN
jgi:hypothetical protein